MSPHEHAVSLLGGVLSSSSSEAASTLTSATPTNSVSNPNEALFSSSTYYSNNNNGPPPPPPPGQQQQQLPLYQRLLLYTVMVLAVVLASRWEWTSQQYLRTMTQQTRQALRLAALSYLEGREVSQLEWQAAQERQQAATLANQAQVEQETAARDELYATRIQNRHDYYQRLAEMERGQAERLIAQENRTEQWRLALQHNVTLEEQQLEQEERRAKLHPGWCDDNVVMETVCNAIGGSIDLKHEQEWIDQEKIKLTQETKELEALEKREYLEELVASLLEDRAEQFNATAADLQRQADKWKAQAAVDEATARQDQAKAQALQEQETRAEEHIHQEEGWRERNHETALQLWDEAEGNGHRAYRYAAWATVLALLTSLYFVPRVVAQAWMLTSRDLGRWGDCDDDNDTEAQAQRWWWCSRTLSYSVMHCIILVLVSGMVGRNYLLYLTYYNLWQRAVIVTWFAYLVAGLQTVLLHNVPHVWAAYRAWTSSNGSSILHDIAVQFLLRLTVTFVFCLLEFLILWLTPFRTVLLAPSSLRLWSTWYVRLTGIVLLVFYIVVFEQPQPLDPATSATTTTITDHSTVLLSHDGEEEHEDLSEQDNEIGSELSPLQACFHNTDKAPRNANRSSSKSPVVNDIDCRSSSSSSPTNDMPLIYFRNMQRAVERSMLQQQQRLLLPSSLVASRYAVNLRQERRKLTLTAEILLSVCSLCVLRYGVAVAYVGHPWKTVLVGIVLLLTMTGGLWWCRHRSIESDPFQTAVSQVHRDFVAEQKKVAVYGSLTV